MKQFTTERYKLVDIDLSLARSLAQKLHRKKEDIEFVRKFYASDKTDKSDKEKRTVVSYISTNTVDRDQEVLLPDGLRKDHYDASGGPVFWGHSYGDPQNVVGQNLWIKPDKDGKGLIAKTAFRDTQFADDVYRLFTEDIAGKGPVLKGWSVGFIPLDWEDGNGQKGSPRRTYKEWELLEYSAVPIPSNRESLTLMYEKGLLTSKQLQKDFEIETDKAETYECECIECGHKATFDEHCKDVKCPECGGEMRRAERPGPGRNIDIEVEKAGTDDEIEIVHKPETTDDYHRIPVSEGHEKHKIRTMTVAAKEGIKGLYCVDCKKIITYLFDKDKWTMEEARTWVDEHKDVIPEEMKLIGDLTDEVIDEDLKIDSHADHEEFKSLVKEIREEIADLKEGRVLSSKNRTLVKETIDALTDLKSRLEELYHATEPSQQDDEKHIDIDVEPSGTEIEIETPSDMHAVIDEIIKEALSGESLRKTIRKTIDVERKKLLGIVE